MPRLLELALVVAATGAAAYVLFRYPKLAVALSGTLLVLAAGIGAEGLQQIGGIATAVAVVRWLAIAV